MYIDATYRGKCIVYATIIIFLNLLSFDFICEDSQWTEFQVWMEFKISVLPLRVLLSVCYSTLLPLLKGNEIVLCHLPKTFIFTLPFMSFAHLKFFFAYDGRPRAEGPMVPLACLCIIPYPWPWVWPATCFKPGRKWQKQLRHVALQSRIRMPVLQGDPPLRALKNCHLMSHL